MRFEKKNNNLTDNRRQRVGEAISCEKIANKKVDR